MQLADAWIKLLYVTRGGENGTNRCHLAVFIEDVAFACHFMATCLPPPSSPIGVLVVLGISVKKLSKMAGNSASYQMYSRYSELP